MASSALLLVASLLLGAGECPAPTALVVYGAKAVRGTAFIVKDDFLGQPGTLLVFTAYHVVQGQKDLELDRRWCVSGDLQKEGVRTVPARAVLLLWPADDLAALRVVRQSLAAGSPDALALPDATFDSWQACAGRLLFQKEAVPAAAKPGTIDPVFIASLGQRGDVCPSGAGLLHDVPLLREQFAAVHAASGGVDPSVRVLKYFSMGAPGTSGAPVSPSGRPRDVIGVHSAGLAAESGAIHQSWAIAFLGIRESLEQRAQRVVLEAGPWPPGVETSQALQAHSSGVPPEVQRVAQRWERRSVRFAAFGEVLDVLAKEPYQSAGWGLRLEAQTEHFLFPATRFASLGSYGALGIRSAALQRSYLGPTGGSLGPSQAEGFDRWALAGEFGVAVRTWRLAELRPTLIIGGRFERYLEPLPTQESRWTPGVVARLRASAFASVASLPIAPVAEVSILAQWPPELVRRYTGFGTELQPAGRTFTLGAGFALGAEY